MSSKAKTLANQQNAKKSTGPKTAAGKAKSALNSAKHGLQANPTVILENNPLERSQYDSLKSKLFEQILPDGELELQIFERYVFALYQSNRARQLELDALDRFTNEPSNELWFHQMERIQKLGAMQERRADKALNEIRKLQRDRITTQEILNELYMMDEETIIPIPATLPTAEMRKSNYSQTNPISLATMLLSTTPKVKAILAREVKPDPIEPNVNLEELMALMQQSQQP
jgi:hypothetical protein